MTNYEQELLAEIRRLRTARSDDLKFDQLGRYAYQEALKARSWYRSKVRVARQPRLSVSAADDLIRMAEAFGVSEDT